MNNSVDAAKPRAERVESMTVPDGPIARSLPNDAQIGRWTAARWRPPSSSGLPTMRPVSLERSFALGRVSARLLKKDSLMTRHFYFAE